MKKILSVFSCVMIFLLFIIVFWQPLQDLNTDLGYYLSSGEYILQTNTVPVTNLFSYTYTDYPFVTQSWLTHVLFYLVYQNWQFTGLTLLLLAIGALLVCQWIWLARSSSILSFSITSLITLGILSQRIDIRPELLSILLFSIVCTLLYTHYYSPHKYIYFIPFIFLIWSNVHIYFVVGICSLMLYSLHDLYQALKHKRWSNVARLPLVSILSVLATTINPHGLSLIPYALTAGSYAYPVSENQSVFSLIGVPQFNIAITFYALALFVWSTVCMIAYRHMPFIHIFFVSVCALLPFVYFRTVVLFCVALYLPLLYGLDTCRSKLDKHIVWIVVVSIMSALFIQQIFQKIDQNDRILGKDMAAFIEKNEIPHPIFNNLELGSYLVYALYPEKKVFIDARPEAYPRSFLENEYIAMQEDPQVFAEIDKKYRFNSIIFQYTEATPWAHTFVSSIVHNPEWKLVYFDPQIMILIKNTADNASYLQHFPTPHTSVPDPSRQPYAYRNMIQFAHNAGLSAQEITLLSEYVNVHPDYCDGISVLMNWFRYKDNKTFAFYQNLSIQQRCIE